RAICASSALRKCSGMRGPSDLAARFASCLVFAGRAAWPTAPPATVRSAAGLTLDFSDAIAGVSAGGGAAAGGGFLSAHHASYPTPPPSSAATEKERKRRARPLRIALS